MAGGQRREKGHYDSECSGEQEAINKKIYYDRDGVDCPASRAGQKTRSHFDRIGIEISD